MLVPPSKRRRLETTTTTTTMDDDWGDDDDDVCFSQDALSKFDEICSQSQGPAGRLPVATSTPRRWDSGFESSQPKTTRTTNATNYDKTSGTAKNQDVSTGLLARPFARSLAPLTRSLAPNCSLRSRPPLRSLVWSLAHLLVGQQMI